VTFIVFPDDVLFDDEKLNAAIDACSINSDRRASIKKQIATVKPSASINFYLLRVSVKDNESLKALPACLHEL
jgi:hypothetical protein